MLYCNRCDLYFVHFMSSEAKIPHRFGEWMSPFSGGGRSETMNSDVALFFNM